MRLFLEATPEEYTERRQDLIKAMVRQFGEFDDELAELLEKALPHKEPSLKYKVLQQMFTATRKEYEARAGLMIKDIMEVLNRSTEVTYLKKAEGEEPEEYKTPEQIEEESEYDPESGEPIEQEEEDEEFEEEGEEMESSVRSRSELKKGGPYYGPRGGKWADPKHTISWREGKAPGSWASANALVAKLGGKIKAHSTDDSKIVVKLPLKHTKQLAQLKQGLGIEDEIITGGKYAILPMPKNTFGAPPATTKPKDKPAPKPKPKKVKPEASPTVGFNKPGYMQKVAWTQPTSIAEAKQWCADLGIGATFPDLETAIDVTKALSEQHPMVLRNVQAIGTSDDINAWAKDHPEQAKLAKQGKHKLDLEHGSLVGGMAIAVAHPLGSKPYTQSVVVFKKSWWNKKKAEAAGVGEHAGFSLSANLADVVRHELGHVEAQTMRHLGTASPLSMWDVWKKHCVVMLKQHKGQLIKDVSDYAATNPHECWAEVSVMRRKNMPMPKWVVDATKEMGIDDVEWTDVAKTEWSKA
jgi:hypothetical protein